MKYNPNEVTVLSNFTAIVDTLSVPLVVNGAKLYFGNVQRLQDTLLQRIELLVNTNLTLAADGSSTLVPIAELDTMYLYLLDKNGNVKVDGIPLSKFKVDTTSTATNSFSVFPGFDNIDIDWQKSYILINPTVQASAAGKVVQVQVQYMWKPGTSEFRTRVFQSYQQEQAFRTAIAEVHQGK
jgi:hypothetical protein